MLNDLIIICLNYILVSKRFIEEYEVHLSWVFDHLQKHSLKAKMKKKIVLMYTD